MWSLKTRPTIRTRCRRVLARHKCQNPAMVSVPGGRCLPPKALVKAPPGTSSDFPTGCWLPRLPTRDPTLAPAKPPRVLAPSVELCGCFGRTWSCRRGNVVLVGSVGKRYRPSIVVFRTWYFPVGQSSTPTLPVREPRRSWCRPNSPTLWM